MLAADACDKGSLIWAGFHDVHCCIGDVKKSRRLNKQKVARVATA